MSQQAWNGGPQPAPPGAPQQAWNGGPQPAPPGAPQQAWNGGPQHAPHGASQPAPPGAPQPAWNGGPQATPQQAWNGAPSAHNAPANGPRWAAVASLGAVLREHPTLRSSRWGALMGAALFFGAAALSGALGFFSLSMPRWQWGLSSEGAQIALFVALPLALIGGLLVYGAWRNWQTAAAIFERGIGYRDSKGERFVAWADVVSVWQEITYRYVNGKPSGSSHLFRLETRDRRTFAFHDYLEGIVELGDAITKASGAALLPGAQRAFEAGERVSFGPIALDRAGLYLSPGASLPWAEIKTIIIDNGTLRAVSHNGARVTSMSAPAASVPNLYVLFTLLRQLNKLG